MMSRYPPYSKSYFPIERKKISANYEIMLERQMIMNHGVIRYNTESEHYTKFQIRHMKGNKYIYDFMLGMFYIRPDEPEENWWLNSKNSKFMYRFTAFFRHKLNYYENMAAGIRFEENMHFERYYKKRTPDWEKKPMSLDKMVSIIDYVILLMT